MFVAIDGIDGSGKTTLAESLHNATRRLSSVLTKEPTDDSPWGRKLRESATSSRLPRDIEIEYFHRDRMHHIENVIQPALDTGSLVISDRYVDSTLAFQAKDPSDADRLYSQFIPEILIPDLTIILVCPVEVGLERISRNRQGRSTFEKTETLLRAASIYESRSDSHYKSIDATRPPEAVFDQAFNYLYNRLVEEWHVDEDLLSFGDYDAIMPKSLSQ